MKIVILDDGNKVVKETANNLKPEDIALVGISMFRGAEEMGNTNKIEEILDTFRAATRELTERSFVKGPENQF